MDGLAGHFPSSTMYITENFCENCLFSKTTHPSENISKSCATLEEYANASETATKNKGPGNKIKEQTCCTWRLQW